MVFRWAHWIPDPGVKAERHVFVGSKAPWFDITDDLPQYDGYKSRLQGAAAGTLQTRMNNHDG